MADYVLKFVDNRPVLKLTAPGPQGPPGLQNVHVDSTPPANPNVNDIWIET